MHVVTFTLTKPNKEEEERNTLVTSRSRRGHVLLRSARAKDSHSSSDRCQLLGSPAAGLPAALGVHAYNPVLIRIGVEMDIIPSSGCQSHSQLSISFTVPGMTCSGHPSLVSCDQLSE